MLSKHRPALIFFLAFAALLAALHLPYLKLPYFWDELGQFVPAALDLYHDGSWIPHTTLPNVHPPGVMALVALVWRAFGYSIAAARLTMLALASVGVLLSFLLAIRLGRGAPGAPAFAAVVFLMVAPIFYTQSMLVMLDMPAMTFTVLALLLFFDDRYAWCAVACTVLVLMKETALTTPAVFAAWLWFRERRRKEALYFAAPAIAVGAWLLILHHATGYWLGNPEFARYNVNGALQPLHMLDAFLRRLWFLFIGDGHFIGTVALFVGWRLLRGKEWRIAALVAVAQVIVVTVLGGAALARYLVPVLPILYAAFATATAAYPAVWRGISNAALAGFLIAGWFWNPPYPFPYENNLAMMDFVHLQQDVAQYLEAYAPDARIATAWPLTDEVKYPDLGYVEHPLHVVDSKNLHLADFAGLDRGSYDLIVVYKRLWPVEGTVIDIAPLHNYLIHYYDYHPQATAEELRAGLGFRQVMRIQRRDQWVEIYAPQR